MKNPVEIEIREELGREPMLRGVIIQEGRAATSVAEIFAPNSIEWPSEGIAVRTVHLGRIEARGQVVRHRDGRLALTARANAAIQQAFADGKRFLSLEFLPLDEKRTRGGIREIGRAFMIGASMVFRPEYDMAQAEVRSKVVSGLSREEVLRWL